MVIIFGTVPKTTITEKNLRGDENYEGVLTDDRVIQ